MTIGNSSTSTRVDKRRVRRWLRPRVPREMLFRLAPARPKPKRLGRRALMDFFRDGMRLWVAWMAASYVFLAMQSYIAAGSCLLAAIVFYLTRPRFHPAAYPVETRVNVESPEFQQTVSGMTGAAAIGGNSIALLNNGDRFYPAMLAAIEQARTSVALEEYIFWPGDVGRRFTEVFAMKAREGVPVRLLVDAIGSAELARAEGRDLIKMLEASGCQLAWYSPIHWFSLERANNRNHRKSLIVDGRIAFTGGAGLADHWLGNARSEKEWRDMMVRVEGPAAGALQAGFAQNWMQSTGEILSGPAWFPDPEPVGNVAVQTILSSPFSGAGAAATMYTLALQCARHSLDIANPYFIPSAPVIEIFERAIKRGVRVRLLLAGCHCDTWWARMNSVSLYGRLIQVGIEVYEYEPAMLHHKLLIADNAWATIGTANFDNRSFAFNEESNLCFTDRALVAQLEEIYEEDLRHCKRIEMKTWRRRGLLHRCGEFGASLIQDQV